MVLDIFRTKALQVNAGALQVNAGAGFFYKVSDRAERAGEVFAGRLGYELMQSLNRSLAAGVSAPLEVVKDKDGQVVVKLHNRLRVNVHVHINMLRGADGKTINFTVRDRRGDWVERGVKVALGPGEKQTVPIPPFRVVDSSGRLVANFQPRSCIVRVSLAPMSPAPKD